MQQNNKPVKTDTVRVREIIKRLEELGLPFHISQDLKQWVGEVERNQREQGKLT